MSIRQPWAELILSGQIDRYIASYKPRAHGFILIHAPLTVEGEAVEVLREHGAEIPGRVATGAFVGAVEIIGIRRTVDTPAELCGALGTKQFPVELADERYHLRGAVGHEVSRFTWILGYPLRFETPLAAAGKPGTWSATWPDSRQLRPSIVAHALQCPPLNQ
jgi:hypothetical protein